MSGNKLEVVEVQQIPPWVRHFMIHVVKRCCMTVVKWIDEMQETSKEATASGHRISQNGR